MIVFCLYFGSEKKERITKNPSIIEHLNDDRQQDEETELDEQEEG